MPWARPTLTDLQQQAIQDITTSGLPGLTGLLRTAVLRVLAWAMAGLAYLVYGYGDWIARMGVPCPSSPAACRLRCHRDGMTAWALRRPREKKFAHRAANEAGITRGR